jgi:hypothetical protein
MARLAMQVHFAAFFVAPLDVLLQMTLYRLKHHGKHGAHQHFDEGHLA